MISDEPQEELLPEEEILDIDGMGIVEEEESLDEAIDPEILEKEIGEGSLTLNEDEEDKKDEEEDDFEEIANYMYSAYDDR